MKRKASAAEERQLAIEELAAEFLSQTYRETPLTIAELKARAERIRAGIVRMGDFDAHSVAVLFSRLEREATYEITRIINEFAVKSWEVAERADELELDHQYKGMVDLTKGAPPLLKSEVGKIAEEYKTAAINRRQSNAAKSRHAKSDVSQLKAKILAKSREWASKPNLYGTDTEFAVEMEKLYQNASVDTVKDWVKAWRKTQDAPPARRARRT